MMIISENELIECGISEKELQSRISVFTRHFGQPLIDQLNQEGRLSCDLINRICERSALVETLCGVEGFEKVKRQMVAQSCSLIEPAGEWFQLRIAFLVASLGEPFIFEGKIRGVPKDLVLCRRPVQIECKWFGISKKLDHAINRYLNHNELPAEPALDDTPQFTKEYALAGFMPGRPSYFTFRVNESDRFWDAVTAKHAQLVDNYCNVLASTPGHFPQILRH